LLKELEVPVPEVLELVVQEPEPVVLEPEPEPVVLEPEPEPAVLVRVVLAEPAQVVGAAALRILTAVAKELRAYPGCGMKLSLPQMEH
jgi:hypothetical protein